jgi:sulfonate transport system substrate-binding protein
MTGSRILSRPTRRATLGLAAASLAAACAPRVGAPGGKLLVGDQRGGSRLVLAGAHRLEGTPYRIEWSQFPNAAPLLEALNAGAIDTGIGGDSAFIFAIGSGAAIKAIGAQVTQGLGPAVVVRGDSPIKSLADLAGKTVATPRGSISHNHVLGVLEANGQPYDAVKFAFLSPNDGRAAFQGGSVDAWAIWDPHVALAQTQGARILTGKQSQDPGYTLMFGRDGAIAAKPEYLRDYRDRLYEGWTWAARNREAYGEAMYRDTGMDPAILKTMIGRTQRLPVQIDAALIAAEQRTADRYFRAGVIAKRIDVTPGFDRLA